MTTTPASTEIQKIEADVKKVITFGMSHIILIALLAATMCGLFYEYDNRKAQAADARALVAEAKGQAADAQNIKDQSNYQSQLDALKQQNVILAGQYSSVMQAMAARDAALVKQQQIIAQMPPLTLASTWEQQIKIPGSVQPQSNGNYQINQVGAVATVQALQSVVTLQQDKASLQAANTNLSSQLGNETVALATEQKSHAADNTTCQTDKNTLNATIAKNKADYKRGRWRWFGAGFIAGITLGLVK